MKTKIQREGDRVWLEGVSCWSSGAKESSIHAAEDAVMRAVGEDIAYDYLVGVSGLAFRMQLSKDGMCPSSPHSFLGHQCVARSVEALPWKLRIFEVKPEEKEKVSEARRAVVESINRGVPVQYGNEEDGLIVGYQKGGEEWICLHPWRDEGRKTFVETKWPWGIAVFTERKAKALSRRELAPAALQQAVEMAREDESGVYFVGFKAWEEYIRRLKSLDGADEKTRQAAMQGNAWIYECLAQYRSSAAKYLRLIAGDFDARAAGHLKQAADHYDKMANEVLRDEAQSVVTIAPYPAMLKTGDAWTAAMRKEEVRRLEAALLLERQAIAEIEKALASIRQR